MVGAWEKLDTADLHQPQLAATSRKQSCPQGCQQPGCSRSPGSLVVRQLHSCHQPGGCTRCKTFPSTAIIQAFALRQFLAGQHLHSCVFLSRLLSRLNLLFPCWSLASSVLCAFTQCTSVALPAASKFAGPIPALVSFSIAFILSHMVLPLSCSSWAASGLCVCSPYRGP